jgi:AraC-like DNA-binding protein
MVKKRHPIAAVDFDRARSLGLEVLTLQHLMRHEHLEVLRRPHRPTFHHLFLITQGEGSHTIDFVKHRLRTGTVFHVAPGQVHQFGREPGLDGLLIVFEPDFVRRQLPALAPMTPDRSRGKTLAALFDATAREFKTSEGTPRARALLRTLVDSIGAAIELGTPVPESAELVQRFHVALEASFHRAREVAAYAAILRCSSRTLTRHCERWAGKSAKRLIDERVVLEARRELAHGDALVSQLADSLGFAEPTQFVKFFRRVTGDTPARFRARVQPLRPKR